MADRAKREWWEQPARNPREFDARDAEEHAEISTLLGSLPENHPARVAYSSGIWARRSSVSP